MADSGPRVLPAGALPGEARAEIPRPVLETKTPLSEDLEDESEWEYEYSATETEIYYLTVDLSTPDFTARNDDHIIHNTRGGYRTWFNPLSEKPDISAMFGEGGDNDEQAARSSIEATANHGTGSGQKRGNEEEEEDNSDEDDNDEDEEEDEEDADEGPRDTADPQRSGTEGSGEGIRTGKDSSGGTSRPAKRKKKIKKDEKPLQIQIMDLHSEQPIISHKGMVFKGCWSRNIGTELVFTTPLDDDDTTTRESEHPRYVSHDQDENLAPELREARAASETASLPGYSTADKKTLPYLTAVPGATLLAASSARLQCQPISIQNRNLPAQRAEAHRLARSANNFVIHITDDLTGSRKPQGRFLEQLMAIKRRRGETDEVTVVTAENPDDAVDDDSEEDFEREKKERKKLDGQARLMRKKMDPQVKGPGRGVGYKPRIRRNKAGARRRKEAAALSSGGPSTPTPVAWPQGYEQRSVTDDARPSETLPS